MAKRGKSAAYMRALRKRYGLGEFRRSSSRKRRKSAANRILGGRKRAKSSGMAKFGM